MKKLQILFSSPAKVILASAFIVFLTACGGTAPNTIVVGHTGSPLLAVLYASELESVQDGKKVELRKFNSSADIAYALLTKKIDAGFLKPSTLYRITEAAGYTELDIVGSISFPYGASLVTQKKLDLRLQDLNGRTIALSSPLCDLYLQFKEDASRLGVDISGMKPVYLPFEEMIPALEAGKIDTALFKGSYAVVAEHLGHPVLYQNWDMVAGDECCPPIIAQLEFILMAHQNSQEKNQALHERLISAGKNEAPFLRQRTSEATGVPIHILESFPLAEYATADTFLIELFMKHNHEEQVDEDKDSA